MMTKDRTSEFFSSVAVKLGNFNVSGGNPYQGNSRSPLLSPSPPQASGPGQQKRRHNEFTQAASLINGSIHSLLDKLEKLTKLAKSKTLFDDRPVEVQELSHIIKKDLAALNERIAQLQTLSANQTTVNGANPSRNEAEHTQNVVLSLQNQLVSISNQFTKVLETRSSNIKAQKDRREQFGATSNIASLPTAASSTSRPRKVASGEPVSAMADNHVSLDLSFQQMAILEQNDQRQLDSRNLAVQGIEATINELGAIYSQLAHMVSVQGEAVQRIDFNIDEVSLNVQRGQAELLRYLRSVSSNRWLMIKIFAVLVMFIVISMFFIK